MTRSIRGRLLVGALAGSSLVLVVASFVVYLLVKQSWIGQLDASLVSKAHAVAALCEENEGTIEFEPAAADLPEFRIGGREAYEIWTSSGAVVSRSPSLGPADLRFDSPEPGRTRASWIEMEGDRPARMVTVAFRAATEAPREPGRPAVRGVVALARDAGDVRIVLDRLRLTLFGVWLASSVVLALVLTWTTRRGLAPLRRLADEAGAMEAAKLRHLMPHDAPVPVEIATVVHALNGLLARLRGAFERERTFVSDVAHELRTPLAGLRATIDVALMTHGSSDAAREDFRRCLAIVEDMQAMVDNLLALARLESGQMPMELGPVSLDEMARECWVGVSESAAARSLAVSWRLGGAVALGDREKLRIVLRNLFANAVVYADERGSVSIESSVAGGRVSMRVANSGCALAADRSEKVFDRFWRGDSSRSGDGAHCGLGLSLCREIVENQNGTIRARCEPGGEFVVELDLPAARAPGREDAA